MQRQSVQNADVPEGSSLWSCMVVRSYCFLEYLDKIQNENNCFGCVELWHELHDARLEVITEVWLRILSSGCDTQNNMVSLTRRLTPERNFVPETVGCGSLIWWLIQICLYSRNITVCNSRWICQYLSTTVTWNNDVVQNCNSLCHCHHNCQMRTDVHHCRV